MCFKRALLSSQINLYCLSAEISDNNVTVESYSMWPKVLPHVKKKSLYNQPKLFFKNFWIDFNKFYTKTFRIVYILTVYLLIMFI